MTFGKIKQQINTILFESYSDKSRFKTIFKEFYSILKKNKTIKEYYVIYSNLETQKFDNIEDATNYLNESLDYLKTLDADFSVAHDFILKFDVKKPYVREPLMESIDTLLLETKSSLIESRMNAKKTLVSHLLTKKSESNHVIEGMLPIKIYTNLIAKKFNKKYENLNEWEKNLIKTIISNDDDKLKTIEESIIKENLDLIESKIDLGDYELKEKLSKVKLKLEDYSTLDRKDSIIKLIQLRSDLDSL
jgi:hypothetical protein